MSGRPQPSRRRRVQQGVLALLLASVALVVGPLPAAHAGDATKVLFLLDVSGSMNGRISSGGTKFAAAQRALKRVADAVPAGTQVGLRVYGSEIAEAKEENPKACTDTKLVLPIGPLNRTKLFRAVDSYEAKGETPIAYSLEKAVGDVGSSGKRVLILISDGEESCAGDPCPAARKLAKAGVDLQFNAIGLAVNSKARKQLQCIAKAGDGNYYDADNTSDLEEAVRRITQRALRPFQVSGTPVKGTVDQGGAPQISVGQYKDAYDASNTPRYYRVRRAIAGSTVTASIASIVRPYPTQNSEVWTLTLATPDGTKCASSTATAGTFHATTVVSGAVLSTQTDLYTRSPAPEPCASASELLLSLARQSSLGNEDATAVELRIVEEPPITNLASLPEAESGYTGQADAVRAKGATPARLGGTSFSNATEVAPGSWRDSVAVAETVFYRLRLEPGQRLRVTAEAPGPKGSWRLDAAEAVTTRVLVYSPARVVLTAQQANQQGRQGGRVTAASPVVRVRNRELPQPANYLDPNVTTAAGAGDYFVALQVDPLQSYLAGRVMPVRLSLAVDRNPSGLPEYAVPSPTPTPTPTPTPSKAAESVVPTAGPTSTSTPPADGGTGGPPALLLAGGGLLVLGMIAGAVALMRRRRSRVRT